MPTYTVARLIDDLRTIAGEWSSDFAASKARMIAEEALTIFLTSRWPFNEGEETIATKAPYDTGTVAVALNGTTLTLTTGTWATTWPTPAIVRIEGSNGDAFLINSFDSTTTATIDKAWPYDTVTASDYSIEFPAHNISNYISITGVMEGRLTTTLGLQQISFEDMLSRRSWSPANSAFWPGYYAIRPYDGTNSQQLWISPAPADVRTIRYRYCKAVPSFRYYRTGQATATNGNTSVTGTSTLWAKQGYSMVGQYFEDLAQPGHQVLITAVGSDTALTLTTGGWTGVTDAAMNYAISPAILCPDDLKPLLRAICRFLWARESKMDFAPAAQASYWQLRDQAISRYNIGRDIGIHRTIAYGEIDWASPPPTPLVMRVES